MTDPAVSSAPSRIARILAICALVVLALGAMAVTLMDAQYTVTALRITVFAPAALAVVAVILAALGGASPKRRSTLLIAGVVLIICAVLAAYGTVGTPTVGSPTG